MWSCRSTSGLTNWLSLHPHPPQMVDPEGTVTAWLPGHRDNAHPHSCLKMQGTQPRSAAEFLCPAGDFKQYKPFLISTEGSQWIKSSLLLPRLPQSAFTHSCASLMLSCETETSSGSNIHCLRPFTCLPLSPPRFPRSVLPLKVRGGSF